MTPGAPVEILYVDDEPNNLISFKASLRLNYTVHIASDTDMACRILEQHPDIRILFCDQRMPGKTGVEFFEEIRLTFPLPIRILITAYADVDSVIQAINRGHIFRYIKKPWTNGDLLSAIEEANKFYITNSLLSLRNEELKKAYTELDKFAFNVSHDIRTPITGIMTGINMALAQDHLSDVKDLLTLMDRSIRKLDNFILNMYDYYNLRMGELIITLIDFETLISDQREIFSVLASAKNVNFSVTFTQTGIFRNDENSIKLIITNLLSNAFKYQRAENEDKRIHLDIRADDKNAVITITDNGIGIPHNDQGQIFDLFFRSGSQEAGFGFGLYNIKNALDKLGGIIEVSSVPDKGTTFVVFIPNKL